MEVVLPAMSFNTRLMILGGKPRTKSAPKKNVQQSSMAPPPTKPAMAEKRKAVIDGSFPI